MKIIRQLIKEFWIPTLIGLVWVFINYSENTSSTQLILENSKNFAAAFFLTSWFAGQIFRIVKQQKNEGNFSNVISRLENVSENLETGLKDFKGYTLGGDSFCYLHVQRNSLGDFKLALINIGRYPMYDIEICLHNLKDESHSDILKRPRDKFGDLGPGLVKYITLDDDEVINFEDNEDNFIKYTATFYCRKGSYDQDIRLIKFEDKWHTAIRVREDEDIIFSDVSEDFPLKEPFN